VSDNSVNRGNSSSNVSIVKIGVISSVSNGKINLVTHSFTIHGQRINLSKEQVIERLKGKAPGPITTHVVEIEGTWYSMKEALSIATGVDRLKFQTAQALVVFEKLGFKVARVNNLKNE
jgi:CRISPR/Cas system-associated exonuclease Cas4 (RecB family)